MSALAHLGRISRAYEIAADEYREIAQRAAETEAAHKTARAKSILRFKAAGERVSHAEAETRAEAEEDIAVLFRERLIAAALADSAREKLRQLREQVSVGRTAVASERAVDDFHGRGITGAA